MFTPYTNGIEEGLNELEELVRQAEISDNAPDIAGLMRHVISATVSEGTAGKARVRGRQTSTVLINVIPSEHEGECRHVLLGLCFDQDNLDDRLREIAYHSGIHCEETKLVVFVTSQWDPKKWKKHEKAFAGLNAKVVIFLASFGKLVRIV